jgi:site-specific DNA-methyltransferase (adenine-specific)/modification methylase
MSNSEIVLANSYEYIKSISAASVDLILTDPPYNLSDYSTGNMQFSWRKTINNDVADWDKVTFVPSEWAEDFIRVLKPSGS